MSEGLLGPAAVAGLFMELLRRTHLSTPSDVGHIVADVAADVGARDVEVLLIDYDQESLVVLPGAGASTTDPLSVAGTIPGRVFSTSRIMRSGVDDGRAQRLWLPLLDGTERLGVMGITSPHADVPAELVAVWERYAHLVAMLIVAKGAYGDAFEVVRRRRPLTIASELAWGLAPPRVFATDDLVLGVMLEPCYDNGGDALDYAVNGRVLHVAVLDAMGHGLAAAGVAAFACAAYRQSRRAGPTSSRRTPPWTRPWGSSSPISASSRRCCCASTSIPAG